MEKINKKILIVEDDNDILFIYNTKLASEGFSVFTAQDGEGGVIVAQKEKPDLILADILLPKMNGVEMAKKIKEANGDIKVIFLTNMKDVAYLENIEKAGEFDYLIKSDVGIDDIVKKIKAKLGIN